MVLSTALFDSPPFKHVIVNGLVLAAGKTRAIWHFLAVYAYERYLFLEDLLGIFVAELHYGSLVARNCIVAASKPPPPPCLFLE